MNTDPFYDWRNPARPCMWSKDYFKNEHVQKINQAIENYNDGLLTTFEFVAFVSDKYREGYRLGKEDAHYPMPAIPTENVFIGEYLAFINEQGNPQIYTPFS